MEFNLAQLRRDWIAGISGEDLVVKVQRRSAAHKQCARPVVISEKDPLAFATDFFAALAAKRPIVLVNPYWGQQERRQLDTLLRAADPPAHSILIPTGGSTGGVKLAIHTWNSLAAACQGVQTFLGGGALDSCCVLPLYHVSGLMQLLRAYHSDGSIRFDEDEVTGRCLSYVPTQLQRALAEPERIQKLRTARVVFVGGAALPDALAKEVRALQLPILPVYGMTETAAMCAAIPTEDFLRDPAAGAIPLGNTRFSIAAEGRIHIQSDALFQGYHGQPPLELAQGYPSGDAGQLDKNGRLHVMGRLDRLIISGGEKVDPHEVERAVAKLDGVREVLAVGQSDPKWGQSLLVYYTGSEVDDWKTQLGKNLAYYKLPKRMLRVTSLPLDAKCTM